ncbi:MAG: response regulator [Rhodothermales bacterium]
MPKEPLAILLVEDNPAHAELVMRGFEDHRIANTIHHVADGKAALAYLFRQGVYKDAIRSPRPHMILLDLRLPKIGGLDVLKQIKSSEELRSIPVVILTTSTSQRDVSCAYAQYANGYVVKPVDFSKFMQLLDELGSYWLDWNCPP